MKELFTKFSISEIIVFTIILALAVKGFITFFDWMSDRLRKHFKKETTKEQEYNNLKDQLNEVIKNQIQLSDDVREMSEMVNILLNSDKDDIKAWITEKHHYFCYKLGYIDAYNLDCIEKRYNHYKEENGNSFVADLMEDIRKLPRVSADYTKEN